ncbi:PhnD/SsuA/transferrin family substrate-binding protein [Sphingobium scionense]
MDAEFVTVKPQIGAFRRMVRELEFDVCEIAPTTYIIARAYGKKFKALPIFVVRRFHHSGLLVRPDAGIVSPKDLEGKPCGVRAYSVTTGVWTRQVLIDEFGVDNNKIIWWVDDEEHVQELQLPANVRHVAASDSLADMMARGDIIAGFDAAAGIGAPARRPAAGRRSRPIIPTSSPMRRNWRRTIMPAPKSIRCTAPSSSRMRYWSSIPGSPAR